MLVRAGVVCGTVLAAGCAGPMFEGTIFEQPPRNDPSVARLATNTQQMNVEFRQLSEQLSALNRSQELLDARLAKVENQLNASPRSQDDIVALRRDIQLIRSERETLKREITDDLAGRIEKIAARQQADINAARAASSAAAAPRASVATRSSAASGSSARAGYEHKVERGQTLSEIARGYGKSVDAIMKANKLTSASSIRVGQVLFIPD
jgi:predicted  nucleic acid-binding Zn-ribbon protein